MPESMDKRFVLPLSADANINNIYQKCQIKRNDIFWER